MTRLSFLAAAVVLTVGVGYAWDHELARAGALSERKQVGVVVENRGCCGRAQKQQTGDSRTPSLTGFRSESASVRAIRHESLYQGKPIRWWARRAVQARKDANARGQTITRLRAQARHRFIPWYWLEVGSCESGLRWDYNGSSGFDGAVQFHPRTWSAYRLPSYPRVAYLASPFQQLVVAELVLAKQGWRAWPACSRKVGLR